MERRKIQLLAALVIVMGTCCKPNTAADETYLGLSFCIQGAVKVISQLTFCELFKSGETSAGLCGGWGLVSILRADNRGGSALHTLLCRQQLRKQEVVGSAVFLCL